MMESKLKIVVVDDETSNTFALESYLRRDFEVKTFIGAAKAISYLETNTTDIIISDKRMPQVDGVEFLKYCKVIAPHAVRILISAYVLEKELFAAIEDNTIFRFIHKPVSEEWGKFDHAIQDAVKIIRGRKNDTNS